MANVWTLSLLSRFEPWVKKKKMIDELQGTLHQKCSSLSTSWLLKETISYNIEQGSSMFIRSQKSI